MWYHIAKVDNKLYQDGIKVDEIDIEGKIVNISIKGDNNLWIEVI